MLSLGEASTARAIESVRDQTLEPAELVRIDHVTPFHRAFNEAAARARSPFLVQVDADMVLAPDCLERLRRTMSAGAGIAVGALRDPLMGRIAGVKLFRTACFDGRPLRDTLAPEIDFYTRLAGRGWKTICLTGEAAGDHLPAYTVEYAFGTYCLLGARYAHRGDAAGLRWRVERLRRSAHELAPVARIALGHGLLARSAGGDVPKPAPEPADAGFLNDLARAHDGAANGAVLSLLAAGSPLERFREQGACLRREPPSRLRGWLRELARVDHPDALIAEAALATGVLGG